MEDEQELLKQQEDTEEEPQQTKKEIKQWKHSPLWLFAFFWCSIIFYECVARLIFGIPFWGIGLLFIALFSGAVALFATALCFLVPAKAGFVVSHVFMGLLMALYILQIFYYSIFNTLLSIFSMLHGGDALQYGDTIWTTLARVWPFIALIALPGVLYLFVCKRIAFSRSLKTTLIAAAAAILVQFIGIGSLFAAGTGFFSPYSYYYQMGEMTQSADKLGLLTTIRLDAQRYVFGMPDAPAPIAPPEEPPTPAPTATPAPTPTPTEATGETPGQTQAAKTPEPTPIVYDYNELPIDFESLAAQTDDGFLKEMHAYFGNLAPTRQNEYTGMFEGYNLITITAEAFAPYAIDPVLTPTLYKMQQEGFNFTDFYCPEWGVSTSDGEYVNCLGLIPKQGVWSLYLTGKNNNALPFALGNQFSTLGYKTNAYHNNSHTYYSRDISHPHMGYTYTAVGNGLEIDNTWPQSDYQMIEASAPDYIGTAPFHTYYMTVSGHMLYSWGGNAMSRKHQALVEDLPLSEESKAYLACNIELDRAMELLLQKLEEAGVAEKTVISISPDHPPYGLAQESLDELIGHKMEKNFEYNKSVWLLYSPGMEPQEVADPVCSLDILPTLSNLFALPYDSRLLMGRDVFSDTEPFVLLGDRSWISPLATFNANTGEVIPRIGAPADDAYVERMNAQVAAKFTYSPKILDYDYYGIVLPEEVLVAAD